MPTTPKRLQPLVAPASVATQPATIETPTRTGPKSDSAILPPDSKVGRFVVRSPLGRGGMGCVYLAWDADLRRTVAVKVMHPTLANDTEHRQRFIREARAVAALSHDNVVSIFEVGQDSGLVFYAMPSLNGTSLAKFLIERGRPSVASAVRIAREIASGLAAAHAVGLLHRDIKPGNVFLEAPKGRAKLLDFGLVTATNGDGRLTEPGMVVGTPAYMSPEQARGLALDGRSDLFSLGAVLYHMTAGRMPFEGPDSLAILTALAVDTPEPVTRVNPKVSPRLERLIARLLCKQPDGRPASAEEVVTELKAIEREMAGGVTNGIAVPAPRELAEPEPQEVVDAEEVTSSSSDLNSQSPTRRRRKGKKGKKAKQRRYVQIALIGGGVTVGLGVLLGLTVLLANLTSPQPKSSPATAPAQPTARDDRHEPVQPWSTQGPEGRPIWWAIDRQGQTRQLPDWWRPGMPLPPEFPPPPRPRD